MRILHTRLALLGVSAAVLAIAAGPASATQAINGEIHSGSGFFSANAASDQWTAPGEIRDLSAQSAFQTDPAHVIPFTQSNDSIQAFWNSADSGRVLTNGNLFDHQDSRVDDSVVGAFGSTFEYDFVADSDGELDFTLQTFFSGREPDVGNWLVGAVDQFHPENIVLVTIDGYGSANTLQRTGSLALTAGHSYVFVLRNSGSTFGNGQVPGFSDAHESGILNWSITSNAVGVPEPAAWIVMLLGFGLTGALLRARRRLMDAELGDRA